MEGRRSSSSASLKSPVGESCRDPYPHVTYVNTTSHRKIKAFQRSEGKQTDWKDKNGSKNQRRPVRLRPFEEP
jgi:hypothetical protein